MPLIHLNKAGPTSTNTSLAPEKTIRIMDSTLESVDSAESAALDMARRCGFGKIIVEHIGLAVREIVTNAIVHGNRSDIQKKVVLTIRLTEREMRIIISDQGDGFDPDRLSDPLSPEALLKSSGRGVYLARTLMDEFRVQGRPAGGTAVTMVKYISSAGRP